MNDVKSFVDKMVERSVLTNTVPFDPPSLNESLRAFELLSKSKYKIIDGEATFIERYGRYEKPTLGIAPFSQSGLKASGRFCFDERMKCSGYDMASPVEAWSLANDPKSNERKKIEGCINRLSKSQPLNHRIVKAATRLSGACYNAAQFKPAVALGVFKLLGAKKILDPCAGWGDRLVAACALNLQYVGYDPNSNLESCYDEIIHRFASNQQRVNIECFEDSTSLTNDFDLVFTSPPYFDTERYAIGSLAEENQSWYRYDDLGAWLDFFMRPLIEKSYSSLKKGGYLALNIKDSVRRIKGSKTKKRLPICENIFAFAAEAGFTYEGVIGMKMKSKPGNQDGKRPSGGVLLCEPIWVWKKR